MIVWLATGLGRSLDPIAIAYRPEADDWRTLAPPPLASSSLSRAVWHQDRLIVVNQEATTAYHPAVDSWEAVGPGMITPSYPGFLVSGGDYVYLWNQTGIWRLDPASGSWEPLPDPGLGDPERFNTAMRVVDGDLYVVGADVYCPTRRRFARWTGGAWERLPDLDLAVGELADCSWASQTASVGDRLVA